MALLDGTGRVVHELATEHLDPLLASSGGTSLARGDADRPRLPRGLAGSSRCRDVIVKLDADISFEPDHFERLLAEFSADSASASPAAAASSSTPTAPGAERNATGPAVWGACRAYRRECLLDVLPLDRHMGWDTLDQLKAHLNGWETRVLYDLPFRHHRPEARETAVASGRPRSRERVPTTSAIASRICVRTLFRTARPGFPRALVGYMRACMRREPNAPTSGYERTSAESRASGSSGSVCAKHSVPAGRSPRLPGVPRHPVRVV